MTRGRHGFHAVPENGPVARSVVADAHHCIMVQVHPRPTEYKCVGRATPRPDDELPSDHPNRFCSYLLSADNKSTAPGLDNNRPIQACPWPEQGFRASVMTGVLNS